MTRKKGSKETAATDDLITEAPTETKKLTMAQQVEHLAGLQFTIYEVEQVIGRSLTTALVTAYKRGQLLEEGKVREAVKRLAIRGSSPAQKQYQEMAADTKRGNAPRLRQIETTKKPPK